jgi:hypothetical protein
VAMAYRPHRLSQQLNMPGQQVVALPLQQIDGEEIGAARVPGATIVRHGGSITAIGIWRNALRLLRPTRAGALCDPGALQVRWNDGHLGATHRDVP